MADYGMQMASAKKARGASPNVYTALMAVAAVALAVAAATMWINGSVVGPDGSPVALQEEGSIDLAE